MISLTCVTKVIYHFFKKSESGEIGQLQQLLLVLDLLVNVIKVSLTKGIVSRSTFQWLLRSYWP